MKSIADINDIREKMQAQKILRENPTDDTIKIVVAMGTCGIEAGAREVFNALVDEVAERKLAQLKVMRTGCLGDCSVEPVVQVKVIGKEPMTYTHVDVAKAKEIVNSLVCSDAK